MGAVVVRKENEPLVPQWLRAIRDEARNNQSPDLHFRTLSDRQKRIICERVADLPVRLFVFISNKQNMRRHKNASAARVSRNKHWFYWWSARILLERITHFCAKINERDKTPGLKLEIEFSRRKDLKRSDFTDYFARLWFQGDGAYLNKRRINWSVFDSQRVEFFDHEARAGLQFADVVASSFFQAVNVRPRGRCCADYAKLLEPRVHRIPHRRPFDEGFVMQPYSLADIGLTEGQKDVFRHYGCPEERLTKAAAWGHSSMGR